MSKELSVSIRGVTPLLMHRYAGEQPSEQKAPRGKKTQDHIDANRRKKWLSAAYFANNTFHIPPENVEGMLSEGAKNIRKGKDFKRAVGVVEDFIPLVVYGGPEDKKGQVLNGNLEDFYKPQFIDIRGVVIQKARVDACRPIFHNWGLKFTVRYDPEMVSERDIMTSLESGALGDFRPRYGRFIVESMK